MATASVSTPVKTHHGIFSSKTAGGRMPLTPSPNTRVTPRASDESSPFTPQKADAGCEKPKSVYGGNLSSYFAKSSGSKTTVPKSSVPKPSAPKASVAKSSVAKSSRTHRDSPKSNIARTRHSPKHLQLGVSDWSLTGTGPSSSSSSSSSQTPSKERTRREVTTRARPTKTTVRISHNAGDRFIPNRTASEGLVTSGAAKPDESQRPKTSGSEGSTVLASAASAFDISGRAVEDDLTAALDNLGLDDNEPPNYTRPPPDAVAYESSLANACAKSQNAQFRRRVQTAPERVLDAPGLLDDYYLNLLDWSSGNQVAIGLERNVYVWSAETGTVSCLLETSPDTYISSVKWSGDGAYVGVGLGTGEVQIWDVEEGSKLRSMYGHDSRVGVMGWSKHTLSTGARSGLVFNHDVRIADHKVAELVSHTSEVCGLEWRSDGAQLATGGNDNLVNIWDARSLSAPKFTKTNHRAAVKALSWCPWQLNLLATGGGSYDRHIHFWNTTTGARTNSIDTGSQVTSLRWSNHYREIVSSSGFPDNSLSIWSYPTLVRNVEIPAHETRVLHSSLSPDGQILATAAADESLKFWKVFERKAGSSASASREGGVGSKAQLTKSMTIR
ncbi:WD repeat-containing protein slp1 [Penicillium cataractarum]|uniref:WD repeat-containing protein slp1 n=1 Tax=Penicillium cataractarum TaxID=2100454 RepID=A0A9W9RFL4_9EURO|nr:WD repeat-containing protein slp1 [Penicillium cataractarum]KAJ5359358.1 WD repeat-containing protein slp1 [Penicillium cataractarum]